MVQKTRPPAEKIALGTFAVSTAIGLVQFGTYSRMAAELDEATYPDQPPEIVRQQGRTYLGNSVGAGLVGGGLLYLALRGGFPTQRSIYSCSASSVGFDRKKRLSEDDFQAFLEEGSCKHLHTHDDYFLGLGTEINRTCVTVVFCLVGLRRVQPHLSGGLQIDWAHHQQFGRSGCRPKL